MKLLLRLTLRLVYVLLVVAMCAWLSGCAAYTVATTASWAATQKSLADHALSRAIPHADCGMGNVIEDKYYCEIRDPAKTYNRTGI